jgi:hypothetical protein
MNKILLQKAEETVTEIIEALCKSPLHMSVTYNSNNLADCVEKMTDQEWTAWTKKPSKLRWMMLKLMLTGPRLKLANSKFRAGIKQHQELIDKEVKKKAKARKKLTDIVENLYWLAYATNTTTTTLRASLEACAENEDGIGFVTELFGVSPAKIIDLFDRGVLNYDMASLLKTAKIQKNEQELAM